MTLSERIKEQINQGKFFGNGKLYLCCFCNVPAMIMDYCTCWFYCQACEKSTSKVEYVDGIYNEK